ncbi:MAG: tRNA pseudouridine(55) synthase TruB [Planctomyces sp.]|nr:tRNA pseudouridine(55) synthase TruB [Planctomyces sp.]
MFGLLNLHKPPGATSRDVVNRVQRLLPRGTKVGHAGTLDPLATGVLIVCVGPATRLVPCLHEFPKSYRADFRLGCVSDTDDVDGTIVEQSGGADVRLQDLQAALPEFRGAIRQVPPQHSAIQVGGQRAYALARAGAVVELEPRDVHVHRLDVVEFAPPRLVLDIDCGSGTYIRSIGRDLGQRLGTGAIMTALTRTAIGPFALDASRSVDSLTRETLDQALLPPVLAVPDHVPFRLEPLDVAGVRQGRETPLAIPGTALDDGQRVATVDADGRLIALGEWRLATQRFHPQVVFPEADTRRSRAPSRPRGRRRPASTGGGPQGERPGP